MLPFTTPSPEAELAVSIPAPVLAMLLPMLQAAFPAIPGIANPKLIRETMLHMLAGWNPEGAAEASLAAQIVALQGQMYASLGRAEADGAPPEDARRHRLMARSFNRAIEATTRLLLRLQARREKQEKAEAARTGYGPIRRFVPPDPAWNDPMQSGEALDHAKEPAYQASADKLAPATPPPGLGPLRGPSPQQEGESAALKPAPQNPTQSGEPAPQAKAPGYPAWADMTEAEQYAVIYPDRAVLIRDHGGVPTGATFDRPSDMLAHALIQGRGPVFDELDSIADEMRAKSPCTTKPPARAEPSPQTNAQPPRLGASVVSLPSAPAIAEAQRFITEHPKEAVLIRAFGGVPDWPDFTAPAPAVVRAIVLGRGPAFDSLDAMAKAAKKAHAP